LPKIRYGLTAFFAIDLKPMQLTILITTTMTKLENSIKVPVTHKDYQLIVNSLTQMNFIRSQAWLYCFVNSEFELKRFDVLINDLNAEILNIDFGKVVIDLRIVKSFINSFEDCKKYLLKFGFNSNSRVILVLDNMLLNWSEWLNNVIEAEK
jgi:hypothetical protein